MLGHPYGPNEERGVFRSNDGGQTFEKVLYKDENTGASDIEIDPSNPRTLYACLWEARQGPWENGAFSGTNGGIFKSTDGGSNWHQLTKGLPAEGVVQAYVRVAPGNPKRLYATVAGTRTVGIYRSEDAGETWAQITNDPRPAGRIGGGDLSVPGIDPKNPDIVYVTSTVTWRSTDGGKTWTGIRGAPGGDDYQNIWINPTQPRHHPDRQRSGRHRHRQRRRDLEFLVQPAHRADVSRRRRQRVSLPALRRPAGKRLRLRRQSRGDDGQITFREWHPVGVEEYGYVAPDPLDPDLVYGGKVTVYDRRTGQVRNVSPKPVRTADFRALRTAPLAFSPVDPHALFFASNNVWKTRDGGNSWSQISPDLTRKTWDIPANVGKYKDSPLAAVTQRGVIYALGLSPVSHESHLGRHR